MVIHEIVVDPDVVTVKFWPLSLPSASLLSNLYPVGDVPLDPLHDFPDLVSFQEDDGADG